jgi:hypothetical protein
MLGSYCSTIKLKIQLSVSFVEIITIADLYNFITSLGKLNYGFAKLDIFIAISRICIIGLGFLDVFPIGTTTKLIRCLRW